jgi:hypothetical protein
LEQGKGSIPSIGGDLVIDLPGTSDVHVEVDPSERKTTYAGLAFTVPCVVDILKDSTVVARQAGVSASDKDGSTWISKSATIDGKNVFAFFQTAAVPAPAVSPAPQPSAAQQREPEFRIWTDATGNFKTEAAFLDLKDGKVQLKKKNGGLVTVPLERLSAADQAVAKAFSNGRSDTKRPHFFASPTLRVEVQGLRWIDSVQMAIPVEDNTFAPAPVEVLRLNKTLVAKKGFKLIAFRCSFSPTEKGAGVEGPTKKLKLSSGGTQCDVVAAFMGSLDESAAPLASLTAAGCATEKPEVVFAVPSTVAERDLTLSGVEQPAIAIETLPQLGRTDTGKVAGQPAGRLRFDGAYVRDMGEGITWMLRFYPDGTVVGLFVFVRGNDLLKSLKDLNKESTAYHGQYTLKDAHLTFSLAVNAGLDTRRLSGDGAVLSDTIQLRLENDKEKPKDLILAFEKVDFPK